MPLPPSTPLALLDNEDGTVKATRTCFKCEAIRSIQLPHANVVAWISGTLIHQAFPELSADDREFYFQSGICPTCWGETFGEQE